MTHQGSYHCYPLFTAKKSKTQEIIVAWSKTVS
jgi:hypothetical protein